VRGERQWQPDEVAENSQELKACHYCMGPALIQHSGREENSNEVLTEAVSKKGEVR